jgi:hypothetical protein
MPERGGHEEEPQKGQIQRGQSQSYDNDPPRRSQRSKGPSATGRPVVGRDLHSVALRRQCRERCRWAAAARDPH